MRGEQQQRELVGDEAVRQLTAHHGRDARCRLVDERVEAADRQVLADEDLGEPFGDALALGHQHDPPAVAEPGADVVQRRLGVAAVRLDRPTGDRPADDPGLARHGAEVDDLAVLGPDHASCGRARRAQALTALMFRTRAERRQRPPGQAALERGRAHLGEGPVGRRAEVDRRLAAAGRGGPGGVQELLAGPDQVDGAAADELGVADQHAACSSGSSSTSSSMPSTRAGDNASMPSTACPWAILSSISISSGWSCDRSNARRRTSSVSSSSRQGEATTSLTTTSVERWSATAK